MSCDVHKKKKQAMKLLLLVKVY